eukprot:IDg4849t1
MTRGTESGTRQKFKELRDRWVEELPVNSVQLGAASRLKAVSAVRDSRSKMSRPSSGGMSARTGKGLMLGVCRGVALQGLEIYRIHRRFESAIPSAEGC